MLPVLSQWYWEKNESTLDTISPFELIMPFNTALNFWAHYGWYTHMSMTDTYSQFDDVHATTFQWRTHTLNSMMYTHPHFNDGHSAIFQWQTPTHFNDRYKHICYWWMIFSNCTSSIIIVCHLGAVPIIFVFVSSHSRYLFNTTFLDKRHNYIQTKSSTVSRRPCNERS